MASSKTTPCLPAPPEDRDPQHCLFSRTWFHELLLYENNCGSQADAVVAGTELFCLFSRLSPFCAKDLLSLLTPYPNTRALFTLFLGYRLSDLSLNDLSELDLTDQKLILQQHFWLRHFLSQRPHTPQYDVAPSSTSLPLANTPLPEHESATVGSDNPQPFSASFQDPMDTPPLTSSSSTAEKIPRRLNIPTSTAAVSRLSLHDGRVMAMVQQYCQQKLQAFTNETGGASCFSTNEGQNGTPSLCTPSDIQTPETFKKQDHLGSKHQKVPVSSSEPNAFLAQQQMHWSLWAGWLIELTTCFKPTSLSPHSPLKGAPQSTASTVADVVRSAVARDFVFPPISFASTPDPPCVFQGAADISSPNESRFRGVQFPATLDEAFSFLLWIFKTNSQKKFGKPFRSKGVRDNETTNFFFSLADLNGAPQAVQRQVNRRGRKSRVRSSPCTPVKQVAHAEVLDIQKSATPMRASCLTASASPVTSLHTVEMAVSVAVPNAALSSSPSYEASATDTLFTKVFFLNTLVHKSLMLIQKNLANFYPASRDITMELCSLYTFLLRQRELKLALDPDVVCDFVFRVLVALIDQLSVHLTHPDCVTSATVSSTAGVHPLYGVPRTVNPQQLIADVLNCAFQLLKTPSWKLIRVQTAQAFMKAFQRLEAVLQRALQKRFHCCKNSQSESFLSGNVVSTPKRTPAASPQDATTVDLLEALYAECDGRHPQFKLVTSNGADRVHHATLHALLFIVRRIGLYATSLVAASCAGWTPIPPVSPTSPLKHNRSCEQGDILSTQPLNAPVLSPKTMLKQQDYRHPQEDEQDSTNTKTNSKPSKSNESALLSPFLNKSPQFQEAQKRLFNFYHKATLAKRQRQEKQKRKQLLSQQETPHVTPLSSSADAKAADHLPRANYTTPSNKDDDITMTNTLDTQETTCTPPFCSAIPPTSTVSSSLRFTDKQHWDISHDPFKAPLEVLEVIIDNTGHVHSSRDSSPSSLSKAAAVGLRPPCSSNSNNNGSKSNRQSTTAAIVSTTRFIEPVSQSSRNRNNGILILARDEHSLLEASPVTENTPSLISDESVTPPTIPILHRSLLPDRSESRACDVLLRRPRETPVQVTTQIGVFKNQVRTFECEYLWSSTRCCVGCHALMGFVTPCGRLPALVHGSLEQAPGELGWAIDVETSEICLSYSPPLDQSTNFEVQHEGFFVPTGKETNAPVEAALAASTPSSTVLSHSSRRRSLRFLTQRNSRNVDHGQSSYLTTSGHQPNNVARGAEASILTTPKTSPTGLARLLLLSLSPKVSMTVPLQLTIDRINNRVTLRTPGSPLPVYDELLLHLSAIESPIHPAVSFLSGGFRGYFADVHPRFSVTADFPNHITRTDGLCQKHSSTFVPGNTPPPTVTGERDVVLVGTPNKHSPTRLWTRRRYDLAIYSTTYLEKFFQQLLCDSTPGIEGKPQGGVSTSQGRKSLNVSRKRRLSAAFLPRYDTTVIVNPALMNSPSTFGTPSFGGSTAGPLEKTSPPPSNGAFPWSKSAIAPSTHHQQHPQMSPRNDCYPQGLRTLRKAFLHVSPMHMVPGVGTLASKRVSLLRRSSLNAPGYILNKNQNALVYYHSSLSLCC